MRSIRVREGLLVAALTFLVLVPLTHDTVFAAGNDASRLAHIESLVDHGTSAIERSQFAWTIDRVTLDGHLYSNKPPLMALLGARVYALLKRCGLSLADPLARPLVIRLLALVLVGLPAAWLAAELFAALGLFALSRAWRLLLTFAGVAGTLVLSFATTLNGHVPAAALLLASVHRLLRGRALASGLLCLLAACFDPVPGFGFAPALAVAAWAGGGLRALGRFAAGAACGAAVMALANLVTIGSLAMPKLVPGAADWVTAVPKPVVRVPRLGFHLPEALFGGHGFFTVSPILLFGAAGAYLALRRPRADSGDATPWTRAAAAAVTLAVLAQIIGRSLFSALHGGWSYGFRYLIPVMPVLLLFAPLALHTRRARIAFAAVLPISVLLALLGAYHPWPPAYERVSRQNPVAAMVTFPPGASLAAFLEQHAPGSRAAAVAGRWFVSADENLRLRYLAIFFASKGDEEAQKRYERRAGLP